jgi:hypothetical protein
MPLHKVSNGNTTCHRAQVLNAEVPVRQYWPVALASCAITQQLAVVAASVGVAIRLQSGSISATQLLGACIVLLISGGLK